MIFVLVSGEFADQTGDLILALLPVLNHKGLLEFGGLLDGLINDGVAFLDDGLVELAMRCQAFCVLLIIDGAAVLLKCADEAVVIFEHLAVEAQ